MKTKTWLSLALAVIIAVSLCSSVFAEAAEETVLTDMIGREVTVIPGSYEIRISVM